MTILAPTPGAIAGPYGHELASAPMMRDQINRLLTQVGVLKHMCDLDLLIFFTRHPRSLSSSESLVGVLGYELKEIADSLEVLLAAGLVTRVQTAAHAAPLYVFAVDDTTDGPNREWLPRLLAFASTREGRLALRQGLTLRRCRAESLETSAVKTETRAGSGPTGTVTPQKPRTGTD